MSVATKLPSATTPITDHDPRVRQVELAISNLLRGGVALSMLLIVAGTIVTFAQQPSYISQPGELHRLITPGLKFPHTLGDLTSELGQLRGEAIVTLGLLVLIATPVMRVAISILAFIYQRDRIFTLITSVVLFLLLLSLVLGRGE
ncbi:MAG TPA: DUF1634 domain-containing protein [Lacipirellulaceae bacterium]|jgi:uncharacterized membrane protein|nr:DUF1634 domain-containing protein [Lacipirellulaceae bacterium]